MLTIFNEIDYGPDENQPEDKVIARLGKEVLTAWDEHAIVPPGWKVDPPTLMQHWQDFAANLLRDYLGKNVLVITSNGIARFAPYLTGDFEAFRNQYSLKISTGALCLFEKHPSSSHWQCMQWNIRPQRI
jgi:probable phosphoglycerate mutase